MLESLKYGVIVFEWLCAYPYPSFVRWRLCWLCALPLSIEVVNVGERSCVLPIVFAPNLSGGSLCGKSCVGEIVEILLCEGGDVELCARTSKHILVFAFDLLSLTLSLILCLTLIHIVISHLYAWLCLFVCLTCV